MNILKNRFILFFTGLLFIFLLAFSIGQGINASSLKEIKLSGDVVHQYESINELFSKSEVVAEVEVDAVKSTLYGGVVFSLAKANVKNVQKGLIPNNNLTILETGGIYNNQRYIFEENPSFVNGERAIVFLKKYKGPIDNDAYVILGAYQGKFKLQGSKVIPPVNASPKLMSVNNLSELK
ncbi:hypothetical protein WJ0W_004957 [Paenibacillus melissococcoides]|uniref:Uncharacterized protein n=1 Tax=Paenibacillus melissococcoides TaxID=2912268 RepID=A0ABN8U950_9BACL|nr:MULTISPECIES: hypothetical protein [Paenibacillus]MEB9894454.1 hypothetical protein [Bacillus cereus]CAH8247701.1 hypothetical protein WJ0W_004957 [Paenibacillus melissococcoides]CAH8705707.1 hypothetical protein HTL2_001039 [Paenibacillus melissococcoides]CAH8715180.1 hypothetical protein WDD9_004159 [Paenibacillus melissococcoides]GIO81186.1 hypothetical protein J6TS7_47960 [Paenibacillus dendritiformis]